MLKSLKQTAKVNICLRVTVHSAVHNWDFVKYSWTKDKQIHQSKLLNFGV